MVLKITIIHENHQAFLHFSHVKWFSRRKNSCSVCIQYQNLEKLRVFEKGSFELSESNFNTYILHFYF